MNEILRTPDPRILPDLPNDWSADLGGFKQRWVPGAFGGRETIADVWSYRVVEENWDQSDEGIFRTIKQAEAIRLAKTACAGGESAA
jgi:hypothetical protein